MRLGLLGFPIAHSLSPKLYREILGDQLTSYELFEIQRSKEIPDLSEFSKTLDGLSITAPYKSHFMGEVTIESSIAKKINAINAISFGKKGFFGTNTDAFAVEEILKKYVKEFGQLRLLLLGDGAMAKLTTLISQELGLEFIQFSRKVTPNFSKLDLCPFRSGSKQNIVINSCSRDFIFEGNIDQSDIFWDYNYSFTPHQRSLPLRVKSYQDGQEMLLLQARAAVKFWRRTNS